MKVGFTGTREGMTDEQWWKFVLMLVFPPREFHHGDCVGSDFQAAKLAHMFGVWTVSHPPVIRRLRAFHASDEERLPKTYVARDHDIVDETDCLIATPRVAHEEMHSGTWLTVRYARERGKRVYLILPNGEVTYG